MRPSATAWSTPAITSALAMMIAPRNTFNMCPTLSREIPYDGLTVARRKAGAMVVLRVLHAGGAIGGCVGGRVTTAWCVSASRLLRVTIREQYRPPLNGPPLVSCSPDSCRSDCSAPGGAPDGVRLESRFVGLHHAE